MSVTWTRGREWWLERTTASGNQRHPDVIYVGPDSVYSEKGGETVAYYPGMESVWLAKTDRGVMGVYASHGKAVEELRKVGFEMTAPADWFGCEVWERRVIGETHVVFLARERVRR